MRQALWGPRSTRNFDYRRRTRGWPAPLSSWLPWAVTPTVGPSIPEHQSFSARTVERDSGGSPRCGTPSYRELRGVNSVSLDDRTALRPPKVSGSRDPPPGRAQRRLFRISPRHQASRTVSARLVQVGRGNGHEMRPATRHIGLALTRARLRHGCGRAAWILRSGPGFARRQDHRAVCNSGQATNRPEAALARPHPGPRTAGRSHRP